MEESAGNFGWKERAWIEIDLEALAHNLERTREMLPKGCRLMPVIKANGYGHGDVLMAKALQQMGVQSFCVSSIEEAVRLRHHGISNEILILGYTPIPQTPLLMQYDLTQTLTDAAYAKRLSAVGLPFRAHLAVDTGMHRVGVDWKDREALTDVFALPHLHINGIYSHLCTADTNAPEDIAFAKLQAQRLQSAADCLSGQGHPVLRHLLGSYGLLHYPQMGGDYARVWMNLTGVFTTRAHEERFPAHLRPVLSLKSRVVSVREIAAGESVGYGRSYMAETPGRVATISIGYADGVPRSLSPGGCVFIRGQRAPILGAVCMNQLMADVTDIPGVQALDEVTLIGAEQPAYDVAEASGRNTLELFSGLSERLERLPVRRGLPLIPSRPEPAWCSRHTYVDAPFVEVCPPQTVPNAAKQRPERNPGARGNAATGGNIVQMPATDRIQVQLQYPAQNRIHAFPRCILRKEVYLRLLEAAQRLPPGYAICIWDAWRPFALQKELYESYSKQILKECHLENEAEEEQKRVLQKFLSVPVPDRDAPPAHTTGGAVDVTLLGPDGAPLNMGTDFDDMTPKSATAYYESPAGPSCLPDADVQRNINVRSCPESRVSETASEQKEGTRPESPGSGSTSPARNRRLLYDVMTQAGFTNLPSEWWHYDFGDRYWASVTGCPALYAGAFTEEELYMSPARQ